MLLRTYIIGFLGVLIAAGAFFAVVPFVTQAATQITIPGNTVAICPCCGTSKCKRKCPPCYTQGCFGQCIAPGGPSNCRALGCNQQFGGTAGPLSQTLDLIKSIKDLIGGGQPGGGGALPTQTATNQTETPTQATQSIVDAINNSNSSSNTSNESFQSVFDSIFGSTSEPEENTLATIVSTSTATTTTATSTVSTNTSQQSDGVVGSIDTAGTALNARVVQTADGVTIVATGVDASANTGIGSFFGRIVSRFVGGSSAPVSAEVQRETFVGRLCTNRPWEASVINRILSASFFDRLCVQRGFTPGGREENTQTAVLGAAQRATLSCPRSAAFNTPITIQWSCPDAQYSAGEGFSTNGAPTGSVQVTPNGETTYRVDCSVGGSASCTVFAASPVAEIVAHPQSVPLSARTSVFWVADNVDRCVISGPNVRKEVAGGGLRGSTPTGTILDDTPFTIECFIGGSDTPIVTDTVTVEVGN